MLSGRRQGGKCVVGRQSRYGDRTCKRYLFQLVFDRESVAGKNAQRFSGSYDNVDLKPGRYRTTLYAFDQAENVSPYKHVTFKVVKG